MNGQQIFDNFVNACNGLGQALDSEVCIYNPPGDHPGCAIGCQPRFNEEFPDAYSSIVAELRNSPKMTRFFDIQSIDDEEFLLSMQRFHDQRRHWDGLWLNPEAVAEFCTTHNLVLTTSSEKST